MILYKGGSEIVLREKNSSKRYATGTKHPTKNGEDVTILGQVCTPYVHYRNGVLKKHYINFVVCFPDGTKVVTSSAHICEGVLKNPNKPSVYGVGYTGQGIHKASSKKKHTKTYNIWCAILQRCYSKNRQETSPSYVGCSMDKRWHNFQNFCLDLPFLEGYSEWAVDTQGQHIYELDKDVKIKGNKIYSKDTCLFVPNTINVGRYNKKQTITGLTYIGTRIQDGYTEAFTNQTEFADKYALNQRYVSACCNKKQKTHKGWTFKIKEKEQ